MGVNDSAADNLNRMAPYAMFSVGADRVIRECNKDAERLLGYPPGTLVGMPVSELYPATREGRGKASELFQRFAAGKEFTDELLQMKRADATIIWIMLSVTSLRDAEGRVQQSVSVVRDVTAEIEARENTERVARR